MPIDAPPGARFLVIVLAAQRAGAADPLALKHGVTHKCLVPLNGRPLIEYVLTTLARHPAVTGITVSVEYEIFDMVHWIGMGIAGTHAPITCVASRDNLADSVISAAAGHDGPILITTADNALLGASGVQAMLDALDKGSDVAIAMARREAVLAAHPDGQRRFYRFSDDAYSNCNLYAIAGAHALAAAEIFRGGGQFAKKAGRIVEAFGLWNLLLLRLRLVSLEGGLRRMSRRTGLNIAPVILAEGRQAIDVDNERTHAVAASLLSRLPSGFIDAANAEACPAQVCRPQAMQT